MCELKCIIHYKHLETSNEIITAVNEDTFKKLQESKGAQLTLGGEYIHKEQIDNLPSSFIAGTQGFHRQCYQKFTNGVSVLKQKKKCPMMSQTKGNDDLVNFQLHYFLIFA